MLSPRGFRERLTNRRGLQTPVEQKTGTLPYWKTLLPEADRVLTDSPKPASKKN